jgi:hypothetical protein
VSGKKWCPWQPLRVSKTAGAVWAERFPGLQLWDVYRRAVLSRVTAGDVEATADGVVFCVDWEKDGTGWVLKTIKRAD